MDRKAWFFVTLSTLCLIAWYVYFGVVNPPPPPTPRPPVASATPSPTAEPSATPMAAPSAPVEPTPAVAARNESLEGKNATYVFSNDTGGIERAILKLHLAEDEQSVFLNGYKALPIGSMGVKPGEAWGGFEMTTDPVKGEATFVKRDADGLEVTKRFIIPLENAPDDQLYVVKLETEFRNTGSAEISRDSYFVATGGAAPIHIHDLPYYTRFDWVHDGSFSKIDVNWFSSTTIPLIGIQWRAAQPLFQEAKSKVQWAAATSQYFCTIVSTADSDGTGSWATRFDTKKPNSAPVFGIQGGLEMPGFKLAPGEVTKKTFTIYAGPKELHRLEKLGSNQEAVLDFGMFGFVSKFLLWAMNSLNGFLHNYAAAIIVLTILIKTCLWPIQNKATNEMRKMSLLSPKMTEMREKYKDDPQKMNEEVMKLYREYGVNPFSGCIPMLIQIPIFFGFYTMLGTAIELRNSSFLWVQDLSQPDTIAHVLGFPINVLPIVMAGTMVWQMVITPKSGDAMQQRIFYFMPIIFLVFCYNYASGLALYWTTQNIFSIVQLYLTRNKPLPTLEKKSVIAKREANNAKKKKKRPGL